MDCCIITSEKMKSVSHYSFNYDPDKMIPLGFPRNDILISVNGNNKELFKTKCEKIIVWYPTFRQHKSGAWKGKETFIPFEERM